MDPRWAAFGLGTLFGGAFVAICWLVFVTRLWPMIWIPIIMGIIMVCAVVWFLWSSATKGGRE